MAPVKRSIKEMVDFLFPNSTLKPTFEEMGQRFDLSVYKNVFDLIENGFKTIFISGKAGTGKSTLIDCIRLKYKQELNIVVLAPTGVAALNIEGQTIHSFFKFGFGPLNPEDYAIDVSKRELYRKIDVLVIDEISMVRADILDSIEAFLRVNGPKKGEKFGGVQLVMVGDLFQLPPVTIDADVRDIFSPGGKWKCPYFFGAHSLEDVGDFKYIELDHIFRQTNREFINVLSDVRKGQNIQRTLNFLNERCCYDQQFERALILTTNNKNADRTNQHKLESLEGKSYLAAGTYSGVFKKKNRHTLPAPYELRLKVGAQVMFVKNDPQRRWVNGTIGIVKFIEHGSVTLEVLKNGIPHMYDVQPAVWKLKKYTYDYEIDTIKYKIIGTYKQYPLMLAWSVTIHKSQGKTLDEVIIDMDFGSFACGQLYVALSRATSLEGIYLQRPLRDEDLLCDQKIIQFYQMLNKDFDSINTAPYN